ncbi:MAG TPA: tetratricopeptide repeat protein [Nostocaceae cyanobacterium]|nr:tetratricopeptide repeat protein [Nostocaceae cyanobacterium]
MTRNIENLLSEGYEQLYRGQYQKALEKFQEALLLEPHTLQVFFLLGLAFYKLYSSHESIEYLNQALEIQQDYIPALTQRAKVYEYLDQINLAKSDFYKAIQLPPVSYEDWMYRGVALGHLNFHEEGLNSINQAIKLKPDYPEALMYRGITLGHLEKYEEGLKSINQAIKLKPDYPEALMYKGITLGNLGKYKEGLNSINQAIKLKPKYYEAWMYHGITLARLDRREKEQAISSFDKSIEFQPNNPEALTYRGITLHQLNRLEEALANYDQAIEIKPDYEKAWKRRSYVIHQLLRLECFEIVLLSLDKALKIRPNHVESWQFHGHTLFSLRFYEKALTSYNKVLEFDNFNLEALKRKGLVLKYLDQYDEAIEVYKKCIEIKPNDHETLNSLGTVLEKVDKFQEAYDSYNQAVQIQSDYEEAWYNRSKVLVWLESYQKAIDSYKRTLELNTNHYRAWNGKGNLLVKLENYEEAIEAYRQALHCSNKQFWRAWNNLGWAYVKSKQEYDRALKVWKNGLNVLSAETSDSYKEGCSSLYHSIGRIYDRIGSEQDNLDARRKALFNYNKAIQFLKNDPNLREKYLEILQDLYITYLALNTISKAKEIQRIGSDLLRRLLDEAKYHSKKKKLAFKFIGFDQLTVDLHYQSGDLIKSIETAESGKNACLTWLFDNYPNDNNSPHLQDFKKILNPVTAIIYWHLSNYALHTFIIEYNMEITTINSSLNPNQRLRKFEKWVKEWTIQYNNYRQNKPKEEKDSNNWQDNFPIMLDHLNTILDVPKIIESIKNLKDNIQNLILIPHRDLHRFPLHALFPDEFIITYLPSAQVGISLKILHSHQVIKIHQLPLLSVENPDSQDFGILPYAEIESAAINQLFNHPNSHCIFKQTATNEELKANLPKNYNIFHFTGHSTYNFNNPKYSALMLKGTDCLTLAEILQIQNLNQYQLVCLSACETAMTSNQTITTEYVGLVSAFLSQGVANVVSTLWTVPDNSSAFLMVYFYWQLKKGLAPAMALKKAQKWLRNLTYSKLERIYQVIFANLPLNEKPLRPFIRSQLYKINKMELSQKQVKPFASPYHWAGFIITGRQNY